MVNSSSLKIKQLILINLAHRSTVSTLNVIGQDLKLWFCIYPGFVREQQIFVRLHCIGLLRVVADKNYAVENCSRFAIENPLVELMAGAMRPLVINNRMRVRVLSGADDVEAINPTLSAFMIHDHADIMP